jgi:hypothetical protein
VLAISVGLFAVGALALAIEAGLQVSSTDGAVLAAFVCTLVICVICAVVVYLKSTSIGTVCPKCGKWWAKVHLGRRIIEQKKCYGLVTRRAHSSSTGWAFGTSHHSGSRHHRSYGGPVYASRTTSWQERVPVIRTTSEWLYWCKYCRFQWEEEEVRDVEDFDIERD